MEEKPAFSEGQKVTINFNLKRLGLGAGASAKILKIHQPSPFGGLYKIIFRLPNNEPEWLFCFGDMLSAVEEETKTVKIKECLQEVVLV